MSSGASRMRSGALGTCLNVFFVFPTPSCDEYTPRAAFSNPAGGAGALDLNAKILPAAAFSPFARNADASCFLYSSCKTGRASREAGQWWLRVGRERFRPAPSRAIAERGNSDRVRSRRTLEGEATSLARSRSAEEAFSLTRL